VRVAGALLLLVAMETVPCTPIILMFPFRGVLPTG